MNNKAKSKILLGKSGQVTLCQEDASGEKRTGDFMSRGRFDRDRRLIPRCRLNNSGRMSIVYSGKL